MTYEQPPSMSRQQKALFLQSKFTDFVLGTAPIYKPGPGELLVKNKAASLNPVDWKVQKHGMFVEHYPAIIGVDIAGDVEEVGEGVTSFSKGDRVLSQGQFEPEWGGFQQYVKTRAVSTTKVFLYTGVLLRRSQSLLQDPSQLFV